MRNISLSRSVLVSTVFGVNCAWVATNETFAGNRDVRIGVEHDARVGADLDSAGLHGRQVDVHVDVRDVEHGEHLAARGQHLADIGDAVLDAPVARSDERVVRDVDLVELDVLLAASSACSVWATRDCAAFRAAVAPSSCCRR